MGVGRGDVGRARPGAAVTVKGLNELAAAGRAPVHRLGVRERGRQIGPDDDDADDAGMQVERTHLVVVVVDMVISILTFLFLLQSASCRPARGPPEPCARVASAPGSRTSACCCRTSRPSRPIAARSSR